MDTLLLADDGFPKQLTVKVTNWSCESYIFGGQERPAYVTNIDIKCDNGLIPAIDQLLIPYTTRHPPKVTFIGARDKDGGATLQTSFYGSESGKGLGYLGDILGEKTAPVGDSWKVAANWIDDPNRLLKNE